MSRTSRLAAGLALVALAGAPPAFAQEEGTTEDAIESLRQEVQQLKAGQAAIRRQLAEIKSLVQQGARPAAREPELPDVTMNLAGYPVVGQAEAPITVVEFADFQ